MEVICYVNQFEHLYFWKEENEWPRQRVYNSSKLKEEYNLCKRMI